MSLSASHRAPTGSSRRERATFSKSIDDVTTPYDAYNVMRSLSDLDRTHMLQFNFVYELPFLRNASSVVAPYWGAGNSVA